MAARFFLSRARPDGWRSAIDHPQKDPAKTMSRRALVSTALIALSLTACTTTGIVSAASPINSRWVGRPAGELFAKYNPPLTDTQDGSNTVYGWRGGYTKIKQQGGKTASVSCAAKITVSADYVIKNIQITGDHPGATSASYCTELLTKP
jgi:ABC-type oligopeptide transport system substrate-binding subunit